MKQTSLSPSVTVGDTEIRVIETVRVTRPGRGALASKAPVAVVIRRAGGVRAFTTGGEEIPLRRLLLQYPHLTELDDV